MADLLDIKQYNIDDIQRDDEIIHAFQQLKEKYRIGSQYQWLAELCKMLNISNVEVGFEFGER